MYSPVKELALSVIITAVYDYIRLKNNDATKMALTDGSCIAKDELEDFFRSEWCDFLLGELRLTGTDILNFLNRE